jgi:hypothetical protein
MQEEHSRCTYKTCEQESGTLVRSRIYGTSSVILETTTSSHSFMAGQLYTIYCVLADDQEFQGFPIKVEASTTVGELNKAIVQENPDDLKGINAKYLRLYRVDVKEPQATRQEKLRERISELYKGTPLDPLLKLSEVYTTGPPGGTIHIIVQSPSSKYLADSSNFLADHYTTLPQIGSSYRSGFSHTSRR